MGLFKYTEDNMSSLRDEIDMAEAPGPYSDNYGRERKMGKEKISSEKTWT